MIGLDEIFNIEKQLQELEIEIEKHGNNITSMFSLWSEKKNLQRKLSLAKGEETAIKIEYTFLWDVGAPLPHVISSGNQIFLIYYMRENNFDFDGLSVKVVNPNYDGYVALVKFKNAYGYKFGGINDEVIYAHPLFEHGLEAYGAHIIENSKWLTEEQTINSVHSNYRQEDWNFYKHYFFPFHDEIFECIAKRYEANVYKGTIKDVVKIAATLLFE